VDRDLHGTVGVDCIPWLHDLAAMGRGGLVELVAHPYNSSDEGKIAEKKLRQEYEHARDWNELGGGIS